MIAVILHFDDATLEKRLCPRGAWLAQVGLAAAYRRGKLAFVAVRVSGFRCPAAGSQSRRRRLFLSYLTIHGSGVNESRDARTTLLVQMRDLEDPPTLRTHESRGQGMMLHGMDPTASFRAAPQEDAALLVSSTRGTAMA